MSERKPGYYMIRYAHEQAPWEPAEWDGERWVVLGNSGSFSPVTIGEIGHRIPTPDEPWEYVPLDANRDMLEYLHVDSQDVWEDLLAVAPKP